MSLAHCLMTEGPISVFAFQQLVAKEGKQSLGRLEVRGHGSHLPPTNL